MTDLQALIDADLATSADVHATLLERAAAVGVLEATTEQLQATTLSLQATVQQQLARIAELEAQVPEERVVLSMNPRDYPKGPMTTEIWEAITGRVVAQSGLSFMSFVDTPHGRVLRNRLPAKSTDGSKMSLPLPETLEVATMRSRIVHVGDFPWGLGGKQPGLAGGAPGVTPPSGGHWAGETAWAGRVMWGVDGTAESYMYGPEQPSRTKPAGTQYGEGIPWAARTPVFLREVPQDQEVFYDLNTPGQRDGRLISKLNGRTMLDRDYFYRTRPDVGINYLQWSYFAGGDVNWAALVERFVDLLDFRITTPTRRS